MDSENRMKRSNSMLGQVLLILGLLALSTLFPIMTGPASITLIVYGAYLLRNVSARQERGLAIASISAGSAILIASIVILLLTWPGSIA